MSEQRYTAQEMREMAGSIDHDRSVTYYPDVHKIALMLRQAADAEDDNVNRNNAYLAILKEDSAIRNEIAQLKARLDAVVKESAEIAENLRIHLAVPTQSITMNRAEVEAMASMLSAEACTARGDGEGEERQAN